MPIKNAALYLEECLDSICNQDYLDWELIAVNDHSTDDTSQILDDFAAKDHRISIHLNNGNGIISALRLAYLHSKGKYITRMDADDIMSLDKLSTLLELLNDNGSGHLATSHVKYFSETTLGEGYKRYESWLNGLCINNSHFGEIYKECVIPSPCWMLSRVDLDRCGAFESDVYPEDYDLSFRFYKSGLKVVSTSKVLHYWRDYPVRSSRTDDNYKDNRFIELKTSYFISLDYNTTKVLYLWGAGKKAKKIAQLLIRNRIPFHWISNNPKKIGHNIYGIIIQHQSLFNNDSQVIIAIANTEEKEQIKEKINNYNLVDAFYFS